MVVPAKTHPAVVWLLLLLLLQPQMVLQSCEDNETTIKVLGMQELKKQNEATTKPKQFVHPLGNLEVHKTSSPCTDTVQNASWVSYLPVTIYIVSLGILACSWLDTSHSSH